MLAPVVIWNRIPAGIHDQIIEPALEQSELSPRELAVRFTDERRFFVSEATVYHLLKAHDPITSTTYVVIKAADRFHTQATPVNEMWRAKFAGNIARPAGAGWCIAVLRECGLRGKVIAPLMTRLMAWRHLPIAFRFNVPHKLFSNQGEAQWTETAQSAVQRGRSLISTSTRTRVLPTISMADSNRFMPMPLTFSGRRIMPGTGLLPGMI